MVKLSIRGGKSLRGSIVVRGSKNAATKLMIASLLTDEECVLGNMPLSADIDITKELCEKIGSVVTFDTERRQIVIRTEDIMNPRVPELSRRNRIPVLALGPLLHRKGVAEVPVLGGCPIGHRPINFHIEALTKMGARVERRAHSYYAEADTLRGEEIAFPYPSVGATENVLLTAVLAQGTTVIQNAALEPEIMNLITMLQTMGASVAVHFDTRTITINGVARLRGAVVTVMPDRNEVVSFAAAALATGGDILMPGVGGDHVAAFLEKVKEVGGAYTVDRKGIRVWNEGPYRPVSIETAPHPAFMTDWQQPFCVLLTQAGGKSIIHETVYEDRFGYTKDLIRMGADVHVSRDCPENQRCRFFGLGAYHVAEINGPTKLSGAEMRMTDIRAGMAHMIAALVAEGESVIEGVAHVDRGYEKIDERLRGLGADIRRVYE